VTTEFRQVDATKFLLTLDNAQLINHIVIFLTGSIPFQQGLGASVYLHWTNLSNDTWQLLGMISNEKPSAIFKLTKPSPLQTTMTTTTTTLMSPSSTIPAIAEIGISVEPLTSIESQMNTLGKSLLPSPRNEPISSTTTSPSMMTTTPTTTPQNLVVVKNMLTHFYNYASSFGVRLREDDLSSMCFPVKTLEDWYKLVERRLQMDPTMFSSISTTTATTHPS
jgi:protein Hikeshi